MSTLTEHRHMFKRIRGKNNRYKCIDPDCKFVSNDARAVLSGKRALCPFCRNEFVIKASDFKYATLSCGCTRNKESALDVLQQTEAAKVSELLGDLEI